MDQLFEILDKEKNEVVISIGPMAPDAHEALCVVDAYGYIYNTRPKDIDLRHGAPCIGRIGDGRFEWRILAGSAG